MLRRWFLSISVGCTLTLSLAAEGRKTDTCIHGQISTQQRETDAGVSVTARDIASGTTRSAVSDQNGKFVFCGLKPGSYRIVAHPNGFKDSVQEKHLSPGSDVSVAFVIGTDGASDTGIRLNHITDAADTKQDKNVSIEDRIQEAQLVSNFVPSVNLPDTPSSPKENQPHGHLYGWTGSSLANQAMRLPLSQIGGSLGGGIGEGQTSYFIAFDRYGMNRQRLLSNLAGEIGIGNTGLLADANVLASSAFVFRADHRFSARDASYLRYNRDEMRGNSLLGNDSYLPEPAKGLNVTQHSVSVENTLDLSPHTTNETSAQFIANDGQLPAGASALGLQSTVPTERRNRVFEAANNIYRQVGSQSLRLGGDFLYNQMNISFMEARLGRISPSGLSLSQSGRDAGLYIQSQRQLRPDLQVTTGVRYDMEMLRGFKSDLNNFAPQVGFAWSPGSSRTVLRGGFGMYYDRVPLPAFAGPADPESSANLARSVAIYNSNRASLGELGNFATVSPTIQSSYADHASLGAEQQIGSRSILSAEYEYVRGVQLALPVPRTATLCATTSVCNSENAFTGQEIGSGATSSYSGVSVAFAQQPVRWGNYKVSYTYSNAEGSGTGANDSYINDQMRRVSFTGVLHTSLDPGSTLWQRLTHGFLLSGTGDHTTRSEFLGMNFINLNARLSKDLMIGPGFRLQAMAETFNMFQRTNASFAKAAEEMGEGANEIFSTYMRVATAQNPNGSQAGLRLTF